MKNNNITNTQAQRGTNEFTKKNNMSIYELYLSIIVYGVNITVNALRSFAVLGYATKCNNVFLALFAIFDIFNDVL